MMYWKTKAIWATGLWFFLLFLACLSVVLNGRPVHAAQDSPLPALSFQPAPTGEALYVSFTRPGTVGGIDFDGSDILVYYQKKWFMYFDGSDVGVKGQNLNAFEILADDSILMAFTPRTLSLPQIGHVTHNDVIRFVPHNVGEMTRGRFERFLKGLDIGLTTNSEAIDALAITPEGRLAVSTVGRVQVPGAAGEFTGRGQDVIVLTHATTSAATPDTADQPPTIYWQVLEEGEDLGLTTGSENLNALWIDPSDGSLYLGTRNRFTVRGLSGDGKDILIAQPSQPDDFIRWNYMMRLNGASLGLKVNLDGLTLASHPLGPRGFHIPRRR